MDNGFDRTLAPVWACTRLDAEQLRAGVAMRTRLKAPLAANRTDFDDANLPPTLDKKDDTASATDLLVRLDRKRDALTAKIDGLPNEAWKDGATHPEDARTQARAIVKECLTLPLRGQVRDWSGALGRYRDRLTVLHDVAAPW